MEQQSFKKVVGQDHLHILRMTGIFYRAHFSHWVGTLCGKKHYETGLIHHVLIFYRWALEITQKRQQKRTSMSEGEHAGRCHPMRGWVVWFSTKCKCFVSRPNGCWSLAIRQKCIKGIVRPRTKCTHFPLITVSLEGWVMYLSLRNTFGLSGSNRIATKSNTTKVSGGHNDPIMLL